MNAETGKPTKFKRKKLNLAIKRNFQMWLLIRIMATIVMSSVLAAIILYFYARHEVAASFFDAHIKIRRVSDLLLPVVLAGSAVSLLAGAILALFLPQKIAGPLYRVEQDLLNVQSGDLTAVIRLRRGDILQEVIDTVNDTTESLRSTVQKIKDNQEAIEKILADGMPSDLEKVLESQRRLLDQLRT